VEEEQRRLRKSIYYPIGISLVLWCVKFFEWALESDFGSFGILPRSLEGTKGILLSGFIHGDYLHLVSNTIPLTLLGAIIIYFYAQNGFRIILMLYLFTGCLVWLFARPAYHIGASGLVYGMLSFLLFSGIFRRERQSMAISLIILILYGGSMFSGVLPGDPRISWESHLIGFGIGVFLAVIYRKSAVYSGREELKDHNESIDLAVDVDVNYSSTIPDRQPITFRYDYTEKNPHENNKAN
jgi:membrane associated rhomboid family serine protease